MEPHGGRLVRLSVGQASNEAEDNASASSPWLVNRMYLEDAAVDLSQCESIWRLEDAAVEEPVVPVDLLPYLHSQRVFGGVWLHGSCND